MIFQKKNKCSLISSTATSRVGVSLLAMMMLSACALDDYKASTLETQAPAQLIAVQPAPSADLQAWKDETNPPIHNVARRAGKPFFQMSGLHAHKPLPESSIPLLKFDQIYLSEALIQLLRNQEFKLFIDEDVNDSLLLDVHLSGTFARALHGLAEKGNFFYNYDGEVLHIRRRQDVIVNLPPLGYISNMASKDSNAARFNSNENPYATLQSFLRGFGVQHFNVNAATAEMSMSLTPAALQSTETYFQDIIRRQGVIAYKTHIVRLITPIGSPINWQNILTPQGEPLQRVNIPFNGSAQDNIVAYSGRITPDHLLRFLRPLSSSVDDIDKGLLMQLPQSPVTFSAGNHPYMELCNTPNNPSVLPGLLKVTLQSDLTPSSIDGRIYMELIQPKDDPERACTAPETQNKGIFATSFTANGRDMVVLTGIRSPFWNDPLRAFASKSPEFRLASKGYAEEYAIILEPQLIRLQAQQRLMQNFVTRGQDAVSLPSTRQQALQEASAPQPTAKNLPERISRNPFSAYRQRQAQPVEDATPNEAPRSPSTPRSQQASPPTPPSLPSKDDAAALIEELDPNAYTRLRQGVAPVTLSRPAPTPVISNTDNYESISPAEAAAIRPSVMPRSTASSNASSSNGVIVNPRHGLRRVERAPLDTP